LSESFEIARSIERKALELGFSACGFAHAETLADREPAYREWLSGGRAGEMGYMARNIDVRHNPAKLVVGAKTIISLAASYYFPLPPHQDGSPRISRYAMGNDYHLVLKSMGHELLAWIQCEIGPANGRVFTDSAPLLEREWARRAGIGWIGKNGCLILPHQGSWFFLTEIILDREITSEPVPAVNRCGNCQKCMDACPTQAIGIDGVDPRKCISYLTIEHRSAIPEEFRGCWHDWVFGCDVCQDVCPWNNNPATSAINELQPRLKLAEIDRSFFLHPDQDKFGELFGGTPVERAGWKGILRNFSFLKMEIPDRDLNQSI